MNHNSWWDGLIPFYLDRKLFRQNARGMMEKKQLERYSFFRRLGVYSIEPEIPRSALLSLRYSVESMQNPNASLYIYPEGKLVPFTGDIKPFKKGLGWLAKQCPDADLVPIAIFIHTMKSDKPQLHVSVGESVDVSRTIDANTINFHLENSLRGILAETVIRATTS